ncbi:MAG: vanadium-dependent haloperoxidase [Bryobacteraceae bacterium]
MTSSLPTFSSKLVLACAGIALAGINTLAQSTNPVIDWNRTLLSIVRTPNLQPATVHSTRSFAMMHVAIGEAVNKFTGSRSNAETLQKIAAVAAAHRVLVALYPTAQTNLDQAYQASLAAIPSVPNASDVVAAITVGRRSAERILLERANDGSSAAVEPYVFGTAPGSYQSTPPNFPKQPQLVNWGNVQPFSLHTAAQFRPGPPPALDSVLYATSLNEVQSLGAQVGSAATPDQMLIGKFWNGPIQNYWNEITQSLAVARGLNTADTARVFALLNVGLADSVIAFYDAKYTYNFWRPITAIREANPAVTPGASSDPQWLPEVTNTAPDPSYPGAHAAVSAAAAEILVSTLKTDWLVFDVTSEVMAGVTRHFNSISDAEAEATRSRIYAGAHFSFDLVAGERLGRQVSAFVLEHTAELGR